MSKRIKKIVSCLLVLSCSVMLLTGCSEDKVVTQNQAKQIKFSWWGNDARHIYTLEGVDSFQNSNTNVEVDCRYGEWNGFEKRNKVWMESHTEADVMQINYAWLAQYSPDGEGYYDLYELADYIDLDNFDETDLAFGEVDGKLNAISIAYNSSMMFANKKVYDKYGLEIPETWDDYFRAAEVMSKDGVYPLGMVKKHVFLMLMSYYEQEKGKPFFNEDGTLAASKEDIKMLLEFYCSLLEKKVLVPIDQFEQEMFVNGQVGSCAFWVSDAGTYCQSAADQGQDINIAPYPTMKNAKSSGRYIKPATMYAISKNTESPVEAAMLLNFLLNSDEMAMLQKTEKGVPISKSAYACLDENGELDSWQSMATENMMSERDNMTVILPAMEDGNNIDSFKTNADEYYYGKVDLDTAAQMIYDDMKNK